MEESLARLMAEKPTPMKERLATQRKSKRRLLLEELLEHLPDYEPAPKTAQLGVVTGSDGRTPEMPGIYKHVSVKELHRTLDELYETDRTAHAHVVGYYRSEWKVVRDYKTKQVVKRMNGHRIVKLERVEVRGSARRERVQKFEPDGWIKRAPFDRGLAFVEEHFRGEPRLPGQILKAA
jgi:hypothetical protein